MKEGMTRIASGLCKQDEKDHIVNKGKKNGTSEIAEIRVLIRKDMKLEKRKSTKK